MVLVTRTVRSASVRHQRPQRVHVYGPHGPLVFAESAPDIGHSRTLTGATQSLKTLLQHYLMYSPFVPIKPHAHAVTSPGGGTVRKHIMGSLDFSWNPLHQKAGIVIFCLVSFVLYFMSLGHMVIKSPFSHFHSSCRN